MAQTEVEHQIAQAQQPATLPQDTPNGMPNNSSSLAAANGSNDSGPASEAQEGPASGLEDGPASEVARLAGEVPPPSEEGTPETVLRTLTLKPRPESGLDCRMGATSARHLLPNI